MVKAPIYGAIKPAIISPKDAVFGIELPIAFTIN